MKKYFIDPSLTQFKGQLHIHTTNSDGKLTQKESLEAYKARGYSFLAFTDHNKLTHGELRDGVLILSGIEMDHNIMEHGKRAAYHILGIDVDENTFVNPEKDTQKQIDAVKAAGGIAVVAHPAWSIISAEEIAVLENYDAVEVMNWVSEVYHDRGESSQQTDKLMSQGKVPLLFASDDVHYYERDFAGTATVAVCDKLERKVITDAIKSGSMYATCGPEIKSLYAENGTLYLQCSEAEKVFFISDTFFTNYNESLRWHYAGENPVTQAQYTPCKNDTHVRAVVVDKNGKKAWSNYIDINKIK